MIFRVRQLHSLPFCQVQEFIFIDNLRLVAVMARQDLIYDHWLEIADGIIIRGDSITG